MIAVVYTCVRSNSTKQRPRILVRILRKAEKEDDLKFHVHLCTCSYRVLLPSNSSSFPSLFPCLSISLSLSFSLALSPSVLVIPPALLWLTVGALCIRIYRSATATPADRRCRRRRNESALNVHGVTNSELGRIGNRAHERPSANVIASARPRISGEKLDSGRQFWRKRICAEGTRH